MLKAKNAKKIASKNAWNTYSQAYDYTNANPFTITKKQKKTSNELWNRFYKDSAKEKDAKKAYKDAKKAYKDAKKTAKAEYKAKYKKALADNKVALKKNKEKYLSTGDKSDKIKAKAEYKKVKKKLKQDRYYIKNIGV